MPTAITPVTPALGTAAPALAGKNVLVVDDNAINLDIASETLLICGASVDCAASGEEAIAMISRKAYDLVVLDLTMPHTDGVAVGRAIRASRNNATASILLFTASDSVDAERAAREVGAKGLVLKPVDTDELTHAAVKYA